MKSLNRELGIPGATLMGLGSILGTGVFVSIGIAAGVAGPALMIAIVLAAAVATCNGLSSAQLAANHPVSGGTYEYGYRYINARTGFMAGWFYLIAKSASAATAALGFGGYLMNFLGITDGPLVPIGFATVALMTLIVFLGLRRSNWANVVIVSITVLALLYFIPYGGTVGGSQLGIDGLQPFFPEGESPLLSTRHLLEATALMFVAYTGYGRIATMGEEVRDPRRVIPRAIIVTLVASALLYVGVGAVALMTVGAADFASFTANEAAPLEMVARQFEWAQGSTILAIGAMTAMLGVLLNLILGFSRVLLAMGRRGDMPRATARVDQKKNSPTVAVLVMGAVVAALVLIGDIHIAWSFSAFTVLLYYGITNLAALQLSDDERYYPRAISWAGLLACFFLAFWVQVWIWMVGIALVALGLLWFQLASHLRDDDYAS